MPGRAVPSFLTWTLFRCQSAQAIVRYQNNSHSTIRNMSVCVVWHDDKRYSAPVKERNLEIDPPRNLDCRKASREKLQLEHSGQHCWQFFKFGSQFFEKAEHCSSACQNGRDPRNSNQTCSVLRLAFSDSSGNSWQRQYADTEAIRLVKAGDKRLAKFESRNLNIEYPQ